MKTIHVCGDLVWDTHIARMPLVQHGYFQTHSQTQLKNRHGGAWYLRDVIEAACAAAKIETLVTAPQKAGHEEIEVGTNLGGVAKGFTVWKWFPKAKSGTWRIDEFLGCQSAVWERNGKDAGSFSLCQKGGETSGRPDILVIDDLALGFTSNEAAWPACLQNLEKAPAAVVVKASTPFDQKLWSRLLSPGWPERTTVVVASGALRDAGARLGRGYSWDQTIEEITRVFQPGGLGWPLRHCQRVVVTFGPSGAAVFSRDILRRESPRPDVLQFERFTFDASELEGTWGRELEGKTFGLTSMVTAALVVGELSGKPSPAASGSNNQVLRPSSHIAVSLGLAAARKLHGLGAGSEKECLRLDDIEKECFAALASEKPHIKFQSAFNRELLDDPVLVDPKVAPEPTLLTDTLGISLEFLTVAAEQIVRYGTDKVLKAVPHLLCEKYFTADRDEIERLNTVRNLIQDYQKSPADTRPLSIAVFGQPGSGKSFAIKQLAESLFGKSKATLEFNLSQYKDLSDLHEAFHIVRDKSVQGQLPLVFWDEFDSSRDGRDLGWLKEFLAPMQDSKFVANGVEHPFGKCVFIFAGGTCTTFDAFDRSDESAKTHKDFANQKGPDFISRLRAFVNIKGPNPTEPGKDPVHVVRRAVLLRELIKRHHKDFALPGTEEMIIHPLVLDGFLNVRAYRHGARSMEAIVSLSNLHDARHFGPSELPPREVVKLHVSSDWTHILESGECVHFGPADIDRLAAIMHEKWKERKEAAGWTRGDGKGRDATAKTDSRLVPFDSLNPKDQDANRTPALLTIIRLGKLGYDVRRADEIDPALATDLNSETESRKLIARSEHRRWMREKLLTGAAYSTVTDDDILRHADLVKFNQLPEHEKKLDFGIAEAIDAFLKERGFVLVKRGKPAPA